MFKKILLAYDGSDGAKKALETGIDLVKTYQAELWALTVQERLPRYGGTIDEVQEEKEVADERYGKILEQARARAQEEGLEIKTLSVFLSRLKNTSWVNIFLRDQRLTAIMSYGNLKFL